MGHAQDPAAKADAATARLKEATRAANEATAGLRAATREARDLLDRELPGRVRRLLDEVVTARLAEMGEAIETAQRESVDKVLTEFDALCAALMGEDDPEQPTLLDSARRYRQRMVMLGEDTVRGRPVETLPPGLHGL